ncbi:dimethylmenaquinone methyltransferase, partial [Candidatus Poribacteria bacterium]|nr:dimethylmenaquinone methyltransferase [Candidatus Poribacteria bacterium]
GDIVFGDDDGVVVIPQEVEQQVIQSAFRKVSQENQIRQELLEGASVRSVFDKYGIL